MVSELSVEDLKNHPFGTTHRQTKAIVSGHLTVVSTEQDDYHRGTVLLLDSSEATTAIPCLVDRLHTYAIDTMVYIKKWNFVNLAEGAATCHLEFRMEDLYWDEACKHALWKEAYRGDQFLLKGSLKGTKKSYYTPGDQLDTSQKIKMAGIVYAVSTLYMEPGVPSKFFVQLTGNDIQAADNGAELTAINVLFEGDDWIKFYRYFQIGGAIALQNLSVETIQPTDRHAFHVLKANDNTNVQNITYTEYDTICQEYTDRSNSSATSSEQQQQQQQLTLIHVHKHKTYTGTITRVIDSMFGIYELDNTIIVSLFHLFSYYADMPYRVTTQVRLHHFHAVIVNPEDGETSYLMEHVWQANKREEGYYTLAGCMQSHVEILKFPKQHDGFEETTRPFYLAHNTDLGSRIKMDVYQDIIRRKSTFQQLLRQLEMHAALTAKFVDTHMVKDFDGFQHAFQTMRDQVFATTQTPRMRAGDMINDFVLHDSVCLLGGEGDFYVVIDAYPSLDKIQANLETKREDHNLDLAGGNTMFEKEHVQTQKADYDLTADYYILGMLQLGKNGRLYLADNTSRVLLVLAAPSASDISARAGGIYMVRRLHLFTEDLSFVDSENEESIKRKDLHLTYVVCQQSDLLLLLDSANDKDSISFCSPDLQVTRKLSKLSVYQSHDLPTQYQHIAVQVENRYPVEVCFTETGTIYLECRVIIKWYPIEGLDSAASKKDEINATDTSSYALVLSSRHNSLQWHLDFQVGSFWIIYGLTLHSFIKSINKDTAFFALTLDAEKHTVYPLLPSLTSSSANTIQLTPHYTQDTSIRDPQNLIYNVAQLTNVKELPRGINAAITSYKFCEQPLHVKGVVIIKRFMEGFVSHGTLDKHAYKLYNQLGISTGKTNRKLFIQLRQPDGLEVISIYVDVHQTHYPVGLVIGATVTFRNLIRKKKAGNDEFFFLANAATSIHINHPIPSPSVISMEPALIHTRFISSFLDTVIGSQKEDDRQIFRLYCYINAIINLTLKWECRDCGSIVRNNDCYGMCQGASRVFSVHAFVLISDGTGNATAGIDGERLIFRLLQLSSNQIDALKNLVLNYGQLTYGGWGGGKVTTMDDEEERMSYDPENDQRNAMHGYTLEDLCNNAKRAGQFYLYGQVQPGGKKREASDKAGEKADKKLDTEDLVKELKLRRYKISDNGSLLKTAELPKLRVKVIEITFPDARTTAYEMLDSLEQNDDEDTDMPPAGASASLPTSIEVPDFDYIAREQRSGTHE